MGERIRAAEVARMTSLSVRKVQEAAAQAKIPSATKLLGTWTFDPAAIRAWIRDCEAKPCQPSCQPTVISEVTRYGDVSLSPDASIDEAYERLIRKKPKSGSPLGARKSSARRLTLRKATHSRPQS